MEIKEIQAKVLLASVKQPDLFFGLKYKVMIFQEQVLKVARDLAGFTAGQAEQLRRCLGRKRTEAALQQFEAQYLAMPGRPH